MKKMKFYRLKTSKFIVTDLLDISGHSFRYMIIGACVRHCALPMSFTSNPFQPMDNAEYMGEA
jgi:hypothetical protein